MEINMSCRRIKARLSERKRQRRELAEYLASLLVTTANQMRGRSHDSGERNGCRQSEIWLAHATARRSKSFHSAPRMGTKTGADSHGSLNHQHDIRPLRAPF